MKCFYCGGEMKKDKITHTINRKGYHLLIHEVPAWVCTQCGELYFVEDTINSIPEFMSSIDEKVEKVRKEGRVKV